MSLEPHYPESGWDPGETEAAAGDVTGASRLPETIGTGTAEGL